MYFRFDRKMFNNIYENRRVLLTGDTGFKGSWLRYWLIRLRADVRGYSLLPEEYPNHFEMLGYTRKKNEDIRDLENLQKVFKKVKPEIVFHLAAQPLVLRSYQDPAGTFATNVQGTVNLLECCRKTPSVKAVVVVSSDKCYENREDGFSFRESDPMGGYDPYSASKGCTELVVSSYRRSFFAEKGPLLASARAGNVIGGGDWAPNRLVPDLMKAAAEKRIVKLRSPDAIRPWQHVLEPLSGYLMLGQLLFEGRNDLAQAWNFGPSGNYQTVGETAVALQKHWNAIQFEADPPKDAPHEAQNLFLDCTKANFLLKWKSVWDFETTIEKTAVWYKNFYTSNCAHTNLNLGQYWNDAKEKGLPWLI